MWQPIRWEREKPKAKTIAAFRHMLRCAAGPGHREAIKHRWRDAKRAFYSHVAYMREFVALTPYECGSAGRFAIPCYIVACESGFSWSAYNPSGAASVYQIMAEHGRPFPVTSAADKLAHHRIAAALWDGGAGASNWVCA